YLRDRIDRRAADERNPLLKPQIDPLSRGLREVVARDDRAIRTQPGAPGRAKAAQIAAVAGHRPFADPQVEEPADLEAVAHLPDAIEHGAVTHVARIEREFTAQIRRGRERNLVQP